MTSDTTTVGPVLLNKRDAAAALGGISIRRLDTLVRDGRLTPVMLGATVMFTPAELARFADELPSWEPK
ncbi:hypothetical protein DS6A_60 [Mycobacterium phage DS6A]|uniref:Helix-turn-helix domain-containing protein n=1 Tax=Mycobacterium phage DS6A TaxID=45764 RepID=G8I4H0_9CAUD|nr:hypothetical protein DS6A_60 [Mycobacterium phage DS6A]AER47614.1 hypothetical protein DS6A_60 [Mycobacterium phage DS6A]